MLATVKFGLLLFLICVPFICSVEGKDKFLYFAYGSNLLSRRLLLHNPTATLYTIGKLMDYRVDFALEVGYWNGAVATIVSEPGAVVWGSLWWIDLDQMKNLDKQEGVDQGWYYAVEVPITTREGVVVKARTYIETRAPPKIAWGQEVPLDRRPSNTYWKVILFGANECHLPKSYIYYLSAFLTNGKTADESIRKQLGYPFDVVETCQQIQDDRLVGFC